MALATGESLTQHPGSFHAVRWQGGAVVAGEVSTVNDDVPDNFIAEPLARFTDIDADEPACRPLLSDQSAG